jgi:uncharacterized phage protein (TIGR01671 family)
MREIKFRAWSKEHKVMFRVGGFANMDYPEGNKFRYVTIANADAGVIVDATPQIKTVELMQFTGLKDKNGVEIYEEDIVQSYNQNNKPRGSLVIKWSHTMNRNGWTISDGKSYEVIGNVWENPELLTKA